MTRQTKRDYAELEKYFKLGTMNDQEIGKLTGYATVSVGAIRRMLGYMPGSLYTEETPVVRNKQPLLDEYGEEWTRVTTELKEKYGEKLKHITIKRGATEGTEYPE